MVAVSKQRFSTLRASVLFENKGGRPPRAPSLAPPLTTDVKYNPRSVQDSLYFRKRESMEAAQIGPGLSLRQIKT